VVSKKKYLEKGGKASRHKKMGRAAEGKSSREKKVLNLPEEKREDLREPRKKKKKRWGE